MSIRRRPEQRLNFDVTDGDPKPYGWSALFGAVPATGGAWRPLPYLASAGTVALAVLAGLLLEHLVDVQSVLLVFLMAIIASAIAWGLLPSLMCCVLGVLAFNFFFLSPIYTFSIADPDNAVALFFFFIVAVIVSNLTAATRRQIVIARAQATRMAALYNFSRKLAGIGALDDLVWATAYQISSMLTVRTVVLLPERPGGSLAVAGGYPPEDRLDPADADAARWSGEHDAASGSGTPVMPQSRRLFLPLRTDSGPVGVIGVDREPPGWRLSGEERRLLDALADQAAVAVERVQFAAALAEAQVLAETERLRSAVLNSISHDLRTPLASIIGAASSLRSFSERYGAEQREELLSTLQEEAERLNRFVGNLLDMMRLESGAIELRAELFDLADIAGAALRRAAAILAQHRVEVDLAPDLPMLRLDAVLFEQVLFNLLDNAAKYAPPGSRVDLRARREGDAVAVTVSDEGPGIAESELERVFDKFHRAEAQDRRRAGTGLGLAICRGFVEAQGGRIEAGNRRDRRGAVFTIRLPAEG